MKLTKLLPQLLIILLLACPTHGKEIQAVKVSELARSTQSWDGSPLPAYPAGQPEISILRIVIAAGAELPVHQHPVINAGVLISGELTVVTKENKILHLKAGDPIIEVVDTWHYGKNEGSVPAEIIVFYAGTPDTQLSVKEAEAVTE